MKITSPNFINEGIIPAKYTCDGENVNPALSFEDVPSEAKSLALIVDDLDAPNGTWLHWTLWNIRADAKNIAEDSVPNGAQQGMTDFGRPGWGGPCPPSGRHRYYFRGFALDSMLDLKEGASRAELEKAMEGHIIGKGELMGTYSRK